jgi:methyl-accepting chemotaxis protein
MPESKNYDETTPSIPSGNPSIEIEFAPKVGEKPASSPKSGFSFIPSLKIKGRLYGGFALVCMVLVGLVSYTMFEVSGVSTINHRVAELRAPTSEASLRMMNGLNHSLAALRGWMVTGNKNFKAERAAVWTEINRVKGEMDKLSATWTNPKNVQVWSEFKEILAEFSVAQNKVESIANTPDEQPATRLLVVDAAPLAVVMVGEITNIINAEASMPATAERKALFGMMADVRGTTARGLANIRAFLLTGNQKFHKKFNVMWSKNNKRFAQLKANRHLLNPQQKVSFDKMDKARTAFLPLPDKMFDIRGSKKWNMANYLLVKEAAPRAGKLMTILAGPKQANGSRSGGMVANQKRLLDYDAKSVTSQIDLMQTMLWIMLGAGLAIAVVIAFLTGRSIVNPVSILTNAMNNLADGDKESAIPALDRSDELGTMAQAVQVFKENMIENDRLQAEQRETEQQAVKDKQRRDEEKRVADAKAEEDRRDAEVKAEEERKQALLDMADAFEESVMGVVGSLASATGEMQSSAQSMSSAAEQTSQQASAVAAASEEASTNVQTVASAAEELSSSVQEISRQVSQSNKIAQDAVEKAKETNEQVEGLAGAAQKIGEVVSLINDIASQTNLLALNATIEAARAGDAGKGFAVVASEVKSLATQTAKATDEIGSQINEIQSATEGTVEAIKVIGSTIGEMGEIAASIASAVEEQGASTREIASSVQQAAAGTQEVSSNIIQVTQAADDSQKSSGEMLEAANGLAQQGEVLRSEVEKFLKTVRAA